MNSSGSIAPEPLPHFLPTTILKTDNRKPLDHHRACARRNNDACLYPFERFVGNFSNSRFARWRVSLPMEPDAPPHTTLPADCVPLAGLITKLPAEVGKRPIGFRHLMSFFALLNRRTVARRRIQQFAGQLLDH